MICYLTFTTTKYIFADGAVGDIHCSQTANKASRITRHICEFVRPAQGKAVVWVGMLDDVLI